MSESILQPDGKHFIQKQLCIMEVSMLLIGHDVSNKPYLHYTSVQVVKAFELITTLFLRSRQSKKPSSIKLAVYLYRV
jgi:hypothetical protein